MHGIEYFHLFHMETYCFIQEDHMDTTNIKNAHLHNFHWPANKKHMAPEYYMNQFAQERSQTFAFIN